ncbi:MAG: hypothetical protein ACI9DH_000575 [Halioglobus sp.]|jgi:hypothetical protein
MTFSAASKTAASDSGVATIDVSGWYGRLFQLSFVGITGVSIVTITVTPASGDHYEEIEDNTVTLSATRTVTISGNLDSVKATAATSTDVFTLVAGLL